MYGYVFRCWLLANVMHPFFLLGLGLLRGESLSNTNLANGFIYFIAVFELTFLISAPSLLMGWLVMGILMKMRGNVLSKFCIWLFIIVVIILVNLVILICIIDAPASFLKVFEFRKEQILTTLPSMVSSILASGFYFKKFSNIFYQNKIAAHETNLV